MSDWVLTAGDYEVVVTQLNHITYGLLSALAWPLSLVTMDDTGSFAPSKKYQVAVREPSETGPVLWAEICRGQAAFDLADEMAEQVTRVGIDDFLYKKEHGWRID